MSTLKLPTKSQPAAPAPAEAAPQAAEEKNDLVAVRPTPELNPRTAIMKEAARLSNERADAEAAESLPVTDESGNIVEPEPAPAAEPAAAPAAEAAPEVTQTVAETAPAPAAQPAPQANGIDPAAEYEMTVDGQKVKIKGSQILSTVQKSEAADMRLKAATEILEGAKRQAAALPTGVPAVAPAPTETAPKVLSDLELAERVQFGTREQAAEAIAEIRRRDGNAVTTEGLQQFMAAQLPRIVDAQLAFREATRFVQGEYRDLLADPDLRQLFFIKEDQARNTGDKRPYVELYKEIGDGMRVRFNRPKPAGATTPATAAAPSTAPAATNVTTLAQRQAAKAAAPAAPRLASARMEGGDATSNKPKTPQEIVEEMRRSRGQASAMKR